MSDQAAEDRVGSVEVVAGPMFAGKSEELVRRVRRARLAGRGVVVVNHALDVRAGGGRIASHSGLEIPSATASAAAEIPGLVTPGTELVAIDEAQFFGPDLVDVVLGLADDGLLVVVAGLCVTFDGRPFEPLPALMAVAESVVKLTAVCTICGRDAAYHVRLNQEAASAESPVAEHVGGQESYQARCRRHRALRAVERL
ncbi:thymidine kinase [Xylanimonas protaetiae]|uniref:Thymidine kinase n=1 Tax=Xylanimonas protaetiae TaxID=2509457 RepID=A0A4P6F6E4_9MICO|nr:thymidine kinase [Xylanimonas protaetiae]QAY71550.1 thymidine kinase [Xylanimonas protaetiae]